MQHLRDAYVLVSLTHLVTNITFINFLNKLLFLFPKVDGLIICPGVRFDAGIPDDGAGPGPRAAKDRRTGGHSGFGSKLGPPKNHWLDIKPLVG